MNHRRATTALLVSGVLTITACGDHRDNGSTNEQPATAVGPDPVSAWHVYYDLTHPDPDRLGGAVGSDPVSAWHDYYDLTHPDPDRLGGAVGSDPVSAWHVYYDLTHPDPDRVGGAVGSPEVTP